MIEQNPGIEWRDLLSEIPLTEDGGDDLSDIDESVGSVQQDEGTEPAGSDELSEFKL